MEKSCYHEIIDEVSQKLANKIMIELDGCQQRLGKVS